MVDFSSINAKREAQLLDEEEELEDSDWVPVAERTIPESWYTLKRLTDVACSSAALIATAPILLIAMAGIMINSPGSPIYSQERVGLYGRRFTLHKLRTMRLNAHDEREALRYASEVNGPVFKMRNDPRVFFVGRILRKFSIDELPNLVNVLRGEMSLVGPRPPLPREVEGYTDYALRRLRAKPGITCVWQISGRSEIENFEEWMRLDHKYLDSWSPALDLKIILSTIPAVLFGRGAY